MRALFGIVGLLVVVLIIGMLAKKQLAAGTAPAARAGEAAGTSLPAGTPKQRVEQFQQAVQGAVQGAVQQARPIPDDEK
jgi:Flp pilus assembly protein TadG